MQRLWLRGSALFLAQAGLGSMIYYNPGSAHDLYAAVMFACVPAAFFWAMGDEKISVASVFALVGISAFVPVTSAGPLPFDRSTVAFTFLCGFLTAFCVATAANNAKREGAEEPFPLLFAVAIPLGIGAGVGLTVKLWRWYCRVRVDALPG